MEFNFLEKKEIDKIIQESDFKIDKEIYKATYYTKDKLRNVIFKGSYKGQKAVLKIWKDPRKVYEPLFLEDFLKKNKSKILTAPKLYNYKLYSDHFGYLIEEKINTSKNIFEGLPNKKEREEFIEIYKEYRKNFPKNPPIKLNKTKSIKIWKELAIEKNWLEEKYYKLCDKGLKILAENISSYKLKWTHGHFKWKEIFKIKNKYYLTDFAHCGWKPEFYEKTFVVWSLIQDNWEELNFETAIEESLKWRKLFIDNNLIDERGFNLGMIERSCGAILADIGGSDESEDKKRKLLDIWTRVFKYYLKEFI